MNDRSSSKAVNRRSFPLFGSRSACSTRSVLRSWLLYFVLLSACLFPGCEREERPLMVQPPSAEAASLPQLSDLAPGPQHNKAQSVSNPDENNSWMMAEG